MSEFKGTPGPWITTRAEDKVNTAISTHEENKVSWQELATVYTNHPTCKEEAKANANLIAAAPDLLEALQEADRLLKSEWGVLPKNSNGYILIQKIKAAIAKALGTT